METRCPSCGREVGYNATTCPNCGQTSGEYDSFSSQQYFWELESKQAKERKEKADKVKGEKESEEDAKAIIGVALLFAVGWGIFFLYGKCTS